MTVEKIVGNKRSREATGGGNDRWSGRNSTSAKFQGGFGGGRIYKPINLRVDGRRRTGEGKREREKISSRERRRWRNRLHEFMAVAVKNRSRTPWNFYFRQLSGHSGVDNQISSILLILALKNELPSDISTKWYVILQFYGRMKVQNYWEQ